MLKLKGFKDPISRFLLAAAALYVGWWLLYELVIHPWGVLDRAVIDNLMWFSGSVLELLGYELLQEPLMDGNRYLGVQGGSLLWIGDPCNGITVFAVYVLFLLAYPGSSKWRIPYAIAGVLIIHLLNALRIVALCIIVTIDYEYLNFNHDYTFYVIVYGAVFVLWYIWVERFSPLIDNKQ